MPLSHYVSYAAGVVGTQPSINMDSSIVPFAANVAVWILGTGSFGVQFTLDAENLTDAQCRWFDWTAIPAATVASIAAALNMPVTRLRLVIAANDTGLEFKTLQGFSTN